MALITAVCSIDSESMSFRDLRASLLHQPSFIPSPPHSFDRILLHLLRGEWTF